MTLIESSGNVAKVDDLEVTRMRHLLASRSDYVIGIDEVGLGALAGPMVVGGVLAPVGWSHERVKDSKQYTNGKKLSAHGKRQSVLEEVIKPQVLYYCHIKMTSGNVDSLGIRDAWLRGVWLVATKCLSMCPGAVVVVDGESTGSVPTPNSIAVPKADTFVAAVSAASVLAKVERDRVMHMAHQIYPEYGFHNHVGYGTHEHMVALKEHGPCALHRRSYGPIKLAEATWRKTKQLPHETPG